MCVGCVWGVCGLCGVCMEACVWNYVWETGVLKRKREKELEMDRGTAARRLLPALQEDSGSVGDGGRACVHPLHQPRTLGGAGTIVGRQSHLISLPELALTVASAAFVVVIVIIVVVVIVLNPRATWSQARVALTALGVQCSSRRGGVARRKRAAGGGRGSGGGGSGGGGGGRVGLRRRAHAGATAGAGVATRCCNCGITWGSLAASALAVVRMRWRSANTTTGRHYTPIHGQSE